MKPAARTRPISETRDNRWREPPVCAPVPTTSMHCATGMKPAAQAVMIKPHNIWWRELPICALLP